jgi:hypothetical protein
MAHDPKPSATARGISKTPHRLNKMDSKLPTQKSETVTDKKVEEKDVEGK